MNFFDIFQQLNKIPRPSHHEEKVADYLCQFAEKLGLEYERDAQNCVVIRKPASAGYENADPIVLLNHMDMVSVCDGTRPFDPLNDAIQAYVDEACPEQGRRGWLKAKGTSLGADNGVGLSMALAVLADSTLQHGPLEVLTTTNEEDGMTGAANLSEDFIRGRKVINLDSEDYDSITVGAAGAYLQVATFPIARYEVPGVDCFFRIEIKGGLGGHSGVDINKGRINANWEMCHTIMALKDTDCPSLYVAEINGGEANASIPSSCVAVVGTNKDEIESLNRIIQLHAERIKITYPNEPNICMTIQEITWSGGVITNVDIAQIVNRLPVGVIQMRNDMKDTPLTSNNIGIIKTEDNHLTVSCHTRSFDNSKMVGLARVITREFEDNHAEVDIIMNTPGWQENQSSDFMHLVDETFKDTLGFYPRKVAMHFVLEAGYYVQKYPGIEIACIGPRIIEPHSVNERLEISTAYDIWKVLIELLKRLTK